MDDRSPIDTKRMLAFFAISLLIFIVWSWLFPTVPPPPPPASPPVAAEPSAPDALAADVVSDAPEGEAASPELGVVEALHVSRQSVNTPLVSVEVTNQGGRITSWKLLDQGEYGEPLVPLDIIKRMAPDAGEQRLPVADDAPMLPLQVVTGDPALDARLASALHEVTVDRADGTARITMRWSDGAGLAIEKVLHVAEDSHLAAIEARLTVGGRPSRFRLAWGPGVATHGARGTSGPYFTKGEVVYRVGDELETVSAPDKAQELDASAVSWAALRDSFFAVAFVPAAPGGAQSQGESTGFHVGGVMPPQASGKARKKGEWPEWLVLEAPFSPERDRQSLYVGPLHRRLLPEIDAAFTPSPNLADLTVVGMLEPIAALMHRLMVWFHDRTASWGAAILLLTLVIRAVLFPFTHASLKKMRVIQEQMKVLKPKMDQLKERYRRLPRSMDNRQREQQEMLALYQSAGVSPFASLGGCLPMLLSMPFFFALFQMLPRAAEFRHQPFLFWPDLSSADPWYALPVFMGVTMYLSSRSSVASNAALDPVNRNMMLYLFPIMFTWFCLSAPLGLVVYWTTSNLVQIGQQALLDRTHPTAVAVPAPATKPPKTTGKRSDRSRKG